MGTARSLHSWSAGTVNKVRIEKVDKEDIRRMANHMENLKKETGLPYEVRMLAAEADLVLTKLLMEILKYEQSFFESNKIEEEDK